MIKLNNLSINVLTSDGEYGFNCEFKSGLNFIASNGNTMGKSSVIVAIYYALGLERIIGGIGKNSLTSVYKSELKDTFGKIHQVLESNVFLEISNSKDIITLYRTGQDENRDYNLVTVYYGQFNEIGRTVTEFEDFYVNIPNSTTHSKGFHTFLEEFMGYELPYVLATDGAERKLYLQLLFSGMFIEQKRGWADLFSAMPVLGIRESKKRSIEYLLDLDVYKIEKEKKEIQILENRIKTEWSEIVGNYINTCRREFCSLYGLSKTPEVLTDDKIGRISVLMDDKFSTSINEWIKKLKAEYDLLENRKPKIADNFDELNDELKELERDIIKIEMLIKDLRSKASSEIEVVKKLEETLIVINNDLINNKDAEKLRNMGSSLEMKISEHQCPLCLQAINDSLLPQVGSIQVMSIEENIKHLDSQKKLFEFAIITHNQRIEEYQIDIQHAEKKLIELRTIAISIRNDIMSVDEDISEANVRKKIKIQNEISGLRNIQSEFLRVIEKVKKLSIDWSNLAIRKKEIPNDKFSDLDKRKKNYFKNCFVKNLIDFRYKSTTAFDKIQISDENFLPTLEGFDMKYDSSASDNIRYIWGYTVALLQTSLKFNGNHSNILIFDEPDQHSIVQQDLQNFFNSLTNLGVNTQAIVAITINSNEIKEGIKSIDGKDYHFIELTSSALQKK